MHDSEPLPSELSLRNLLRLHLAIFQADYRRVAALLH